MRHAAAISGGAVRPGGNLRGVESQLRPDGAERTRRLLAVARALGTNLDLEAVLGRVLAAAAELTCARYAALGVIDASGEGLERFLTLGLDDEAHRAIGELPRGHGVLGELIRRPAAIRLTDIGSHPASFGFPTGHPPMETFLGVPIIIHGQPWGNLYLTEKSGGDFDDDDEEIVVGLAGLAAAAIDNARVYGDLKRRNEALERMTRRLSATREIAQVLAGVNDPRVVRDLTAKRSRALLGARAVLLLEVANDELLVTAVAGELDRDVLGARAPRAAFAADTPGPLTRASLPDVPQDLLPGDSALFAELRHRGRAIGGLVVVDPPAEALSGAADAEDTLTAIAATAALAIAGADAAAERERALAAAGQLAAIVEGSDDAIYSRDREGRLTSWNRGAEKLFGWRADEVLGRTAEFLARDGEGGDVEALFRRVLRGEPVDHIETARVRRDGSVVSVSLTVSPVRDDDGQITAVATIARDTSERALYEEELRKLADTDPLTGLSNRRRFFEDLEQLLAYLLRYKRPGAVLMIDLDDFKRVNDMLGHEAGDELLVRTADVLRTQARRSDLVARLGGDEFIVALPEVDAAQAEQTAQRLDAALHAEATAAVGATTGPVTASVGVATFAAGEEIAARDLVRRADEAMYEVKRERSERFGRPSAAR